MTSSEFLDASGKEQLGRYVRNPGSLDPLPEAIRSILEERLAIYMVTGGMPEAVLTWIQTRSVEEVEVIQKDILTAYQKDFSKHPEAPPVCPDPSDVRVTSLLAGT